MEVIGENPRNIKLMLKKLKMHFKKPPILSNFRISVTCYWKWVCCICGACCHLCRYPTASSTPKLRPWVSFAAHSIFQRQQTTIQSYFAQLWKLIQQWWFSASDSQSKFRLFLLPTVHSNDSVRVVCQSCWIASTSTSNYRVGLSFAGCKLWQRG